MRNLSLTNRRLDLSSPIALPEHGSDVLGSRLAVNRKAFRFAPRNERLNVDVDLLNLLALTLEIAQSLAGTTLPLFIRVLEFGSVFYGIGQAPPLLSVKPRKADN